MLLDTGELKGEPRALVVVDRFSPRVLVTVAQVAGGASLIERRFGGLHWLAAAHVGAVLGGLVNAWISDVRPLAACQGDQLGAVWALCAAAALVAAGDRRISGRDENCWSRVRPTFAWPTRRNKVPNGFGTWGSNRGRNTS